MVLGVSYCQHLFFYAGIYLIRKKTEVFVSKYVPLQNRKLYIASKSPTGLKIQQFTRVQSRQVNSHKRFSSAVMITKKILTVYSPKHYRQLY